MRHHPSFVTSSHVIASSSQAACFLSLTLTRLSSRHHMRSRRGHQHRASSTILIFSRLFITRARVVVTWSCFHSPSSPFVVRSASSPPESCFHQPSTLFSPDLLLRCVENTTVSMRRYSTSDGHGHSSSSSSDVLSTHLKPTYRLARDGK